MSLCRQRSMESKLCFSNSNAQLWELDHIESWALKDWCFQTVVLKKTLESPLDSKEIQPIKPKGNQSWIFIGRTDAEAETPILWPPDAKSELTGKDLDAQKDWRQEEKGNNRGWDGWMASLIQWSWVWANSGRWWRTGKSGVLQSMGSQRVGHNWVTELMEDVFFLFLKLHRFYKAYTIITNGENGGLAKLVNLPKTS